MIDTITYAGTSAALTKTVTHAETVESVDAEITALQAQLDDFEQGQATTPSDEIAAAIANYQAQLSFLRSL